MKLGLHKVSIHKHLYTNNYTLGKGMNHLVFTTLNDGLNSSTTVFYKDAFDIK